MHRAALAIALLIGSPVLAAAAPPETRSLPLAFADLPGWGDDDHGAALKAYRRTCTRWCAAAARAAREGGDAPRLFFERRFHPVAVSDEGFLTGYFEPEVAGSLTPDATHRHPLLSRPADLVARPEVAPAGWPDGLAAARRVGAGYEPMPDRAATEDGALAARSTPIVYLADPVDAFVIHIQGSARIRLSDGRVIRVGFDGKNGHPYTAIGKVVAEREGIPPSEMNADRLWAWLRAHPDEAPAIMRTNRSYIFFRIVPTRAEDGPVGGAGVPLTPGRSLAIDRAAWPYGVPVWLSGDLPRPGGGTSRLRRLVVAQDTGSAIVGRARGDLFFGSGREAGTAAGLVRHPVRWVVLEPKPSRRPSSGRKRVRP